MKPSTVVKNVIIVTNMFLIVLCSGTPGHARELDLKFDHVFDLGSPGGQTMLQDNDGFLWVGTEGGGMFKYDGYGLKNYGVGPASLSNGTIWRILEDSENPDIFWIGTNEGLHRFDKSTDTFTYYKHDPNDRKSLGDNGVLDIVQDGNDPNILWLGTTEGGLNKFEKNTETFTRYEADPNDPHSLSWPEVWRMIEDRDHPN
ncbi:MAG: hypothetical protein GY801_07655, partial [bacterium]|nr:hypothetical protein [bacterium]